jgi:hypothetical protein
MIARIAAYLKSKLGHTDPEASYAKAYNAYQDAMKRGDTRDQGETWKAMRAAQTARLKAEVRCTGIGWRKGFAR